MEDTIQGREGNNPEFMENESNGATDCLNSEPKEVAMEIRDWSELTSVCLTNIFHRLSLEDRWRGAMLVCRSWLEAAKDPMLFSSFDLEPAFEAAGAGRPDTPFWWTPAFQRRVDAMLRSVSEFGAGGVREIRVRHCSDVSLGLAAKSLSGK